jgi:hypothetical protein
MEEQKGYVALLDVLGFAELVTRKSERQELSWYINCASEACEGIDAVLFSDSIVLTHPAESKPAELRRVLTACSTVVGRLIASEIPVRGAVAYGTFYRFPRQSSVFIAGRPIVEAYDLERRQDWLGVTLCPSVLREHEELRDLCRLAPGTVNETEVGEIHKHQRWCACVQPWDEIPVRNDRGDVEKYDGFAVVPSYPPEWLEASVVEPRTYTPGDGLALLIGKVNRMRETAPHARAQAKYERTRKFLSDVQDKWRAISEVFARFQLSAIDATKPTKN